MTDGILASQQLQMAVACGWIHVPQSSPSALGPFFEESQFQPASLDVRLGPVAYRMQSSFLPGCREMAEMVDDLCMYKVPLVSGGILERGHVYLIPLVEQLNLPSGYWGKANPKSSTGRVDVFTRLLTTSWPQFDMIPDGYHGPLYLEVFSRSFTIKVQQGISLHQIRLMAGVPAVDREHLYDLTLHYPGMLRDKNGAALGVCPGVEASLSLSLDLGRDTGVVYKARPSTGVLDLRASDNHYAPGDFWERVPLRAHGSCILEPEHFYLCVSRERVCIPRHLAAELRAYDPGAGELRSHYAGFFDPSFGDYDGGILGAKVVFEIRAHDVPFLIEDGQIISALSFEQLAETPNKRYGHLGVGSHYADPTPRVFAKYFHPWTESE